MIPAKSNFFKEHVTLKLFWHRRTPKSNMGHCFLIIILLKTNYSRSKLIPGFGDAQNGTFTFITNAINYADCIYCCKFRTSVVLVSLPETFQKAEHYQRSSAILSRWS